MRAGVLILSCGLHGAAVVAALVAGVHVGRRLPAPAVRIETSVPASPAPPPAMPAPPLVVEAAVDPLGGPLLPAEAAETVAPPTEPVFDLVPRPPTAPPSLASLRRVPPPAAADAPAAEAAPEVPAERCADNEPPHYPEHERQRGHEGTVVVAVSVAADGSVLQASLRTPSPFPGLNREALRAVRGWRFTPARRAGIAVASETTVTIVFRLRDERDGAVR